MLDFSKRQKKYWDITLHDGTPLQLPTPTRDVYDSMMDVTRNAADADANQLAEVVGQVLRTNKQGMEITEEQIRSFDLDDMYEFFTAYIEFIKTVLSDPNSKSLIAR